MPLKAKVAWPWFVNEGWSSPAKRVLLDTDTLKPTPLRLHPNHSLAEEIERAFNERVSLLMALCKQELGLRLTQCEEWVITPDSPEFFYAPKLSQGKTQWDFVGVPKKEWATRGAMPLTESGKILKALAPQLLEDLQRCAHKQFEAEVARIKAEHTSVTFSYAVRCYSDAACAASDYAEAGRVWRRLRQQLEGEEWAIRVEIRDSHEPYDYPTWAGNAPEYLCSKIRSWGFDIKAMDLREYRGRRAMVLELNGTPSRDRAYITLSD